MKVSEVMTKDVFGVSPEAPVSEAARHMQEADCGALPVMENSGVLGIITDRDIAMRVVAQTSDVALITVGEVMSPNSIFCNPEQDVSEAAKIMREHHVRRLLVRNDIGELVGVISLGDIAQAVYDPALVGEALREVSESTG